MLASIGWIALLGQTPASSPATTPAAVELVQPVNWSRFERSRELGGRTKAAARLLNTSLRYNLGWAEATLKAGPEGDRYVLPNMKEHGVRPVASVAVALAIALATGVYDGQQAGLQAEEARLRLLKLIRGLAAVHKANAGPQGWGDHWQSAHWAAQTAQSAWLTWEHLDASTRRQVVAMVTHEADRFIQPGYQVPYWNGQGGDTKAEENAWNAMVHQVTVAMMPKHPRAAAWKRIASELMVSAFATQADWESNTTLIDGRPVRQWLKGYNIRDDGALVNHNLIHCDYMTCITMNLRAYLLASLAGQMVPESARFNAHKPYAALVAQKWPSPPYQPPGGTMYIPGRAEVYYPQGTDWSRYRFDIFYHVDVWADALGLDRELPHKAAEWLPIREQRLSQMQARHNDGRLFAPDEFKKYPGAEQMAAWIFADAFLVNWLSDHQALSKEGNWNDHGPSAAN